MEMKWYDVKSSNVILVGNFPYFEDTDKVEICNLGFGTYKGIEVKKCGNSSVYNGDCYKTKNEALSALANYNKDNTNYSNEIFNQNIICKPNNKTTRRDLFNNSLLKGEYYDTKNKRYMYRKMVNGYRKTITAPTLEELRDKEKDIEKEINTRKEKRSTKDFINFIQNELPDVFKELKHEFNKMEDFKHDTG